MALTQISTNGIKDATIATADIADDAVTEAKIANNAITTAQINNGEVTNAKLAANAVTADKINNGEVTTDKLSGSAVSTAKIANDAVTSDKIADSAVVTDALSSSAVSTAKIADQAVTLDKLPHGTSSNDGKFLRANNGSDPTFESLPASVTINNAGSHRIITSGGSTTLDAEGNLTFDGDTLTHGTGGLTNAQKVVIQGSGNSSGDNLTLNNWGNSDGDYWTLGVNMTANSGGSFAKTDTNLRCAGINIDGRMGRIILNASETSSSTVNDAHTFQRDGSHYMNGSLYLGGETSSSHELADYEEGTFTPNIQDAASGGNSHGNSGVRQGAYTKVGSLVNVMITCRSLSNSGLTGAHQIFITNLPFRMSGVEYIGVWTQIQYFNNISNTQFGTHWKLNNNQSVMRLEKMADNAGANPIITFNHWMYSSGYYGFATSFSYTTDQ